MQAGKLRDRVQLQSATTSRDSIGGFSKSWTTYATVWGALKSSGGTERKEADKTHAQVTCQWEFRFRSDVMPRHRILFGDRTFEITRVSDPDSMRVRILAECVEEISG